MTDPQVIINLGTGGSDLNGQNGSTSSADSNDARFLDWPGDNAGNYVYLPGVSGNSLTVPDEAALDITGDIDLRVQVALDDWTPPSGVGLEGFMGKRTGFSTEVSWSFYVNNSGLLVLVVSTDGTNQLDAESACRSTVAPTVTDGSPLWVRATLDVDDGSGNRVYSYFTSSDGVTWSALGTPRTISGTTSIYSSTADVRVGTFRPFVGPMTGKVYRAQVLDGIDGTTVLDIDTSVITSGSATSFTALTGQTVTINRSTSGRKSVAVVSPVWLFGTDDYMEVADNALLDFDASTSATVIAIVRTWDTPTSFQRYVAKMLNSVPEGWTVQNASTLFRPFVRAADGSYFDDSGADSASGELALFGLHIDRSAGELSAITNTTFSSSPADISSAGAFASSQPMRVGRRSDGFSSPDAEFLAVMVFRRALSAAEIASIVTYYQNKAA